jgi:hypothetical protein
MRYAHRRKESSADRDDNFWSNSSYLSSGPLYRDANLCEPMCEPMPLRWVGYGREGLVRDNYGYDPRETDFDPTVSYYPQQPQDAPPEAPLPPNTMADQPTSQVASTAQPTYVPYPVVVSDDGDSWRAASPSASSVPLLLDSGVWAGGVRDSWYCIF